MERDKKNVLQMIVLFLVLPTGRSTDSIFSCSQCSFKTLKSGMLMTHMIEHDRTNTCVRKNSRYYTFSQDIDVQEHEVITDTSSIVDLSLAHDLLEVCLVLLFSC